MGPLARFFAGLPQDSFEEVRRQREQPGADQARLAVEDRRAFAREFTRNNPVLGPLALMFAVPGEQVVKGAMSLAGAKPGDPYFGRSGFTNPIESVGAGFTGVLQGLNDRGLFSPR